MCFHDTHRAIGSENAGTWCVMMWRPCGHMRANTHVLVAAWKCDVITYLQNWFNATPETHWDRQKHMKTCEKHVLSDLTTFWFDQGHMNSLKDGPSRVCRVNFEDLTTHNDFPLISPTQSMKTMRVASKPMYWSVPLLKIITWWLRKDVMMMVTHADHN